MGIKKISHFLLILLFTALAFFSPGNRDARSSVFPLDEENVFCIYFKMSGRYMQNQDLEELSSTLGMPTFTSYKPSEMFMKNSLRRLRYSLQKKIKRYGKQSLFKWSVERIMKSGDSSIRGSGIVFRKKELPHPTPFIRSEVSEKGLKSINRILDSLIPEAMTKGTALSINVYLKPEKIEYRFSKRNIACEDVFLPHGYVIFRPVRLEISDLKNPVKILTSRDISKR